MSDLVLVPIDKVLAVMPDVQPMIEPAINRSDDRWDIWSVIAMLLNGQMQLWLSINDGKPEAAMVTRIIEYPKMRVLSLPFIGGRARENWMHFEEAIIDFGRRNGCAELEGYARKGWLRILKGWIEGWTYIRRPI